MKRNITIIVGCVATIMLVIVAIIIVNGCRPTVYSISGGTLSISTEFGQNVKISDIKSVQLKESLPSNVSKVNGLDADGILKGKFRSNIGNITLYVNDDIPQFIYIETTSGLIIINDKSVVKTRALFHELYTDIGNR